MTKKIYGKLVVIFVIVFLTANVLSYHIASLTSEKSVSAALTDLMAGIVSTARDVYEKGNTPVQDIEALESSGLISVTFYTERASLEAKYSIPDGILDSLGTEPRVFEATGQGRAKLKLPMSAVKSGDIYIIAVPTAKDLLVNIRELILRVNFWSLVFGSLLMMVASGFIVKPVKILSAATEKIARGDFSVRVEKKRRDEIGQLIENFNIMARELQGMEILRNGFVSDMSHEFRTPLTSIEGYAKLLRDCRNNEERNEYIDIITQETRRLSTLSSGILLLNKIENENLTLVKNTYRLDEQVRQVILLLENKWSSKEIDLQLEIDELYYEGSEQLLHQVWLNLFDNAVKFSKPGGVIEISLRHSEGKTVFRITDYGRGLTEEDKKKMFDKFYSGDRSGNSEGNGLGLSIVRQVIDMHGGRIEVRSRLGEFTEVKVLL